MTKRNCFINVDWDYLGFKDFSNGKYTNDWNQTLITKINQISAHIYKATLRGGANCIEIHPNLLEIVNTLEFYDESLKKIAGRYDVILNEDIENDIIHVFRKPEIINDVEVIPNHFHDNFMMSDNFQLLPIESFSESEINKYHEKCNGYVRIKNFYNEFI